jgi:hypothetical protein
MSIGKWLGDFHHYRAEPAMPIVFVSGRQLPVPSGGGLSPKSYE